MKDLKLTWGTEIGRMIKDISDIIMSDGTITIDERKLIRRVNQDVNAFVRAFIKALEDNTITAEENDKLKRLWKKIQENAEKTAMIDQIITLDERKILLRIAETITARINKE
ncbi:MAG: hypothetical protein ACXADY_14275 [Candidatus Hodarchaeales archaeon]|jgi:flagellar capping protein FliD